MKKLMLCVIFLFMIISAGFTSLEAGHRIAAPQPEELNYNMKAKRDVLCLMLAYPEYITGVYRSKEGNIYIVMKSGRTVIYDDKKIKTPEELLGSADLQDMLEQSYPLANIDSLMDKDCDPGRHRIYPLLKEVYGGTQSEIKKNLINVKFGGRNYQFNRNNGAADSLTAVMQELVPLARSNGRIGSYVFPPSGTFNYRHISGTGLLSAHSFGIAIDLVSDRKDYWKWASRKEGQKRLTSYPKEIVDIFEKNGFVWGGKWGHFDILHFEYRPEIILKAKYFGEKAIDSSKPWYDGAPSEDELIRLYIKLIEENLG